MDKVQIFHNSLHAIYQIIYFAGYQSMLTADVF